MTNPLTSSLHGLAWTTAKQSPALGSALLAGTPPAPCERNAAPHSAPRKHFTRVSLSGPLWTYILPLARSQPILKTSNLSLREPLVWSDELTKVSSSPNHPPREVQRAGPAGGGMLLTPARASVPGAQGKPSYTESALLLQLTEILLLFYFVYFSERPSSFQKKIAVVTNILLVWRAQENYFQKLTPGPALHYSTGEPKTLNFFLGISLSCTPKPAVSRITSPFTDRKAHPSRCSRWEESSHVECPDLQTGGGLPWTLQGALKVSNTWGEKKNCYPK